MVDQGRCALCARPLSRAKIRSGKELLRPRRAQRRPTRLLAPGSSRQCSLFRFRGVPQPRADPRRCGRRGSLAFPVRAGHANVNNPQQIWVLARDTHHVEVQASTLFEAGAAAVAAFRNRAGRLRRSRRMTHRSPAPSDHPRRSAEGHRAVVADAECESEGGDGEASPSAQALFRCRSRVPRRSDRSGPRCGGRASPLHLANAIPGLGAGRAQSGPTRDSSWQCR